MNNAHRLRAGTHAVVDLTSTYAISNFPLQADMGAINAWYCNSTPPRPQQIRQAISGKQLGQGYYTSRLEFDIMTHGMVSYMLTTFFSSATLWSNAVTVMLYSESDAAVYLTATLLRPAFDALPQNEIGYTRVNWDLIKGTIIT